MLLIPQQLFAAFETEFTPSLSISETYDDNIDLDNTDEIDDWMTSISPGITLNIISQKNNFSLNYSPSFVRYKDYDENDTTRHALSFSSNMALSQHVNFNISDRYIKSDDPLEDTEDIIGVRETRNTYQRNNVDANIKFTFGASSDFTLGFSHSWLENDDDTIDDGTISDPYASYTYWFNVKHGLEINAGYTKAEFTRDDGLPPDDDYSGFTEGIGYRYRFDQHSVLSVDFDFTDREFESSMPGYGTSTPDYEVYEGTIGYEKSISENMSWNISTGYFIRQDDLDEDDGGFIADISLTKNSNRSSFNLSGRSGWGEASLDSERRGFTKYQSVASSFRYQITENISNNVSVSYRQDKDESSRKSKTIRAGFGCSWTFLRYYSMSLDYSHAVRDDDREIQEYKDNRVMLSIRWSKPYR
jgi:hypothetical protein